MSISSNIVPKDAGDWFDQMSRRMRILERHRHDPTTEDTLTLLTTQAEVIQSMSSGFTFVAVQFITDGTWAQLHLGITRSGADIASNTDGNIANVGMGFLLPQWQPAMYSTFITDIGGQIAAGYIDVAGQFVIGALPPGSGGTWVSGKTIYFGSTYILKTTLAV